VKNETTAVIVIAKLDQMTQIRECSDCGLHLTQFEYYYGHTCKPKDKKLTKPLAKFVLLNALVAFDGKQKLLAAGPLVKTPSTRIYRIVLIDRETGFTVHQEFLNDDNADLSQPITCGSTFEVGNYFKPDELHKAYACFGERILAQAKYIESMYRLIDNGPSEDAREIEMYLDYVNNFVTVKAFAEHYKMTESEATDLITRRRRQ
jgi:hypothetical protein